MKKAKHPKYPQNVDTVARRWDGTVVMCEVPPSASITRSPAASGGYWPSYEPQLGERKLPRLPEGQAAYDVHFLLREIDRLTGYIEDYKQRQTVLDDLANLLSRHGYLEED